MKKQQTKHNDNPAIDAGQTRHGDAGCVDPTLVKRVLGFILSYGYTSQAVIMMLAGGDAALGQALTEQMKAEGLIRTVQCNQQRSGELLKLTPRGVDFAVAVLGLRCFDEYDTTSRLHRQSFARHDLSSQLYLAGIVRRQDILGYFPEVSLPPSRKAKYFDLIVVPKLGWVVGVEIERSPKYKVTLRETLERSAMAIRRNDVDQVIFVLPTALAAAQYIEMRNELMTSAKQKRCQLSYGEEWIEFAGDEVMELEDSYPIALGEDNLEGEGDSRIELRVDDFKSIDFIVGSPVIWRGAL